MDTPISKKFEGPTTAGVPGANWASELYPIRAADAMASTISTAGKTVVTAAALGLVTAVTTWSAISPQISVPTVTEIRSSARYDVSDDPVARRDLLEKIRAFSSYEENWDGYGGKAASSEAVRDVSAFVRQLSMDVPQPDPQLSGDGEISLIWDLENLFIDVGFYGDGRMAYYVNTGTGGEFFGQAVPVADGIPHDISKALNSAKV